jgi:hypothetical protein
LASKRNCAEKEKIVDMKIGIAIIIFIVTNLILCSCTTNGNNFYENICNNKHISYDTSHIDLQNGVKENDEYLGLRNMQSKSDTFILRVEYYDSMLNVLEFTHYKDYEQCTVYKFPLEKSRNGTILFDKTKNKLSDYASSYKLDPRRNEISIQLKKNSILEQPSSFNIPNYPTFEYSSHVYIQYSNHCLYNIIVFENSYEMSSKFHEAKSIVNFLEFLKKRFNF